MGSRQPERQAAELAALRQLPQPLHLFEFAFASRHYHFGLFDCAEQGLVTAQDAMARLALRALPRCDHAVDIGCGLGGTTMLLGTSLPRVTGIDPCAEAVNYARQVAAEGHTGVHFEVATLAAYVADRPEQCGGVIALEILQHFPDLPGFFADCARLLEPSGHLVVHDVTIDRHLDWDVVPMYEADHVVSVGRRQGYRLEQRDNLTHQVTPTVDRFIAGLLAVRELAIEFFQTAPDMRARCVAPDFEPLLCHLGELRRAFECGHLRYETFLFRRQ